ncbi:MAG: HlyC/CorC family transporter [Acidobacteria bacterium]|nr:HlyC/CorC family transporter [Acidobacteriota bacterium]
MEGHLGYRILLMLFIVGLNAFFAASEVALVSSRQSRLKALAGEGHVGAHAALSLLANSERMLSVVQVGVTLCSLALGVVGEKPLEEQFIEWLHPLASTAMLKTVLTAVSTGLAYMIMTYMHVVIGEVVPKNAGIDKRERLAVVMAPALLVFYRVAEPFVYVLERSAAAFSRLIGVKGEQGGGHSVEELKFILSSSLREGVIQGFAEKAMQRLIELQDYLVREIMVPRNQVVSAPVDAALDQLLRLANEHQYTRLPVYEDSPEHLIGYVHVKDLLRVWEERRIATERRRAVRPFDLRRFLRKLPVAPESKPVVQLLDEFRATHSHIAMVVDEFGTTVGVVTLEDVVEQVFGEIEDEHDVRRPRIEGAAAVIHLDGTIPIRDLELQYGIELPAEGGYETLAGFLLYRLGFVPKAGDHVEENGRRYVIEEMNRHRIARVRVEKISTAATAAES